MESGQCNKVKTQKMANVVVVVVASGWRGDRNLGLRTIRGIYQAGEDALNDIHNAGPLLNRLADECFAEWSAKQPAGQEWSVSECSSRNA